ncbi:MAG TPA: hypothetical protein VGR96_13370, partial [Acidobacteriaceae bacterium]|nr:hypothetical protein [Acidobacteriaceae bacterium]
MSQAWQIARRLLFQNRWLYLLLILWPLGMALAFDLPGFGLEQGDVLVLLHQESLYGLAFVCFTASVQLGNEQRSRRIVGVLSRAVSRSQYLFALLCAAWLPLALYAASFLLGGLLLAAHTPLPASQIVAMTVALLALGLWTAAVSLLFAAWLVPLLASA